MSTGSLWAFDPPYNLVLVVTCTQHKQCTVKPVYNRVLASGGDECVNWESVGIRSTLQFGACFYMYHVVYNVKQFTSVMIC